MSDYRVYVFDDKGRIAQADWIDARSDDEAVILVRSKKMGHPCEIWDRQRLVASVPPYSEQR